MRMLMWFLVLAGSWWLGAHRSRLPLGCGDARRSIMVGARADSRDPSETPTRQRAPESG